jgi:hypothetical protein
MMNLQVSLISFWGAISTVRALSCACITPNPSFSNALYTKKYAVKVDVKKQIIKPTPPPAPYDPDAPIVYMPYSWEPMYFEAKVKDIFKQDAEGGLELKNGEKIVVRGGVCSYTPTEKTDYIVFSSNIHEMDVPGYGAAKVLDMPGYCEFFSTWDELDEMEDDRKEQLKRYKKSGETPCFDGDCDNQMVAFAIPLMMCPDGSHVTGSLLCEYNDDAGQCQFDLEMEECPPP